MHTCRKALGARSVKTAPGNRRRPSPPLRKERLRESACNYCALDRNGNRVIALLCKPARDLLDVAVDPEGFLDHDHAAMIALGVAEGLVAGHRALRCLELDGSRDERSGLWGHRASFVEQGRSALRGGVIDASGAPGQVTGHSPDKDHYGGGVVCR